MAENQTKSRTDRFKKPTHKLRNTILAIIAVLAITAGGFAWYAINNAKSTIDKVYKSTGTKKARNVSSVVSSGKPLSILLFGTDTGELGRTYKGRTDSMMLLLINPKTEKTTMISIPRDAMVAIPGYEDTFPQKMNAAYAYGSTSTAIKTVEAYLNIPVDFYALVNMAGLEKMVTQVGGISVKSPLDFTYSQDTAHDYGPNLYRFHKGSTGYEHSDDNGVTWSETKHVMTGDAALAFSRMRYDDPEGDYGRQKRQRLVLEGLIKKSANVSSLLNNSFMTTLSKNVLTDLTFGDMTTIASKYIKAKNNIVSEHIQGVGTSYPDASGNAISYEVVTQKEKQRVTNLARKALGLKAATTGPAYGGEVPSTLQAVAASLRPADDESSSSTDSSSDTSTESSSDQ
ncbi:LCP family protein [Leuconostoc falkenbergense]|jgi:polyisoprenyl-teichoic acid--peptidoglycan teichoic acid transferase|uniref:LCP family protein n=1 Tax=Leuconostoc falkenbergense TaxID=2766470 RepID=A0ABT7RZZ6_9LACO|nr:LCP family protein [Leuconostoc falkenbergense]RDG18162.1 LytR family transcriptional regulator [Leuconostoc pseudomesenteroides]MCT4389437.1 LytR family transcriptional regulator [Leuconostoc falkenbergense]MCT4411524.1 LytR family transcriptional regulator [Leuconostoc falkenbergense]MDM7646467.1 LCP family protein [Leuconostoc falkenbergense]MDV3545788.1 LCP family protein [Leuconostoc falkenbergense]